MVIAVPQILKVIDESRESAWKDSVNLVKNSLELKTNLINPTSGNELSTISGICSSVANATNQAAKNAVFEDFVDLGDMDVFSCSNNTFTLKGKGQFNGKEATISFSSDGKISTDIPSSGGSSGGGSGGSEPAANYKYISPTNPSESDTLASGEFIWLQKNKDTNVLEVCAAFPNGTLCYNEDSFNLQSTGGKVVNGDKTSAFTQKVTDLGGSVFYLNGDANISSSDIKCTYSWGTFGCGNNDYSYTCYSNYGNIGCKDER